jgi:ATP-dependent exoDNAse (exonuclease V) alpha subunit
MEKHEALTVHRVKPDHLVAHDARGEERTFTPGQTRNFSIHEAREIDVAVGDRLLLTSNRRDNGFRATNGELVTVRSVKSGSIQLEDARTLPANYREFDHGYAVTAHRSQGKTVDGVILSGDVMKQELFYVAASRGRSEIAIVTSDRELLRESLGISTARPSATELGKELGCNHRATEQVVAHLPSHQIEQRKPQHEIHHGYDYGIGF